ncbi:FitA-like ribbon-helix-helix domain-containing protein [Geminicoccus harenae]|uniref:FitA-like ribbon-helix-helix domain-containing protein n=1 Tax=Geminicoccus harenae TaxID=2498453 RepID=UPI00168BAE90|nr:hypothetical protein [Geminicoccus harenae]
MQVTIDQLEPEVVAALQRRAQAAGRSLEQELREILLSAARDAPADEPGREKVDAEKAEAWVERLRAVRRELWGERVLPDSAELIRQMRDERTAWLAGGYRD